MPTLRPALLACCVVLAVAAAPLDADAAKKRRAKPAAAPKPPAVTACSDFYTFANDSWLKSNPAPADGSVSALGQLAQRSREQQRQLLDAAANKPANDVQKLLGDFWASGLDEAAVEADGAKPIAPLLARIDAIKKKTDIAPAIAALHQVGIPVAFDFTADLDLQNVDRYMGYFALGGLGLPDASFYTRNDADARALLGRYNGYVRRILALTGTPEARINADANAVIELETRIARAARAAEQVATPQTRYAPVATKDFAKKYRNLRLDAFLKVQGVSADQVSMADPALFAQIERLAGSQKPAQWQAYLRFHVGNAMAPYLSKPWRETEFDFRGRLLRGQESQGQRWEQVLTAIDASAGAMLAQEYANATMSANAKRRAEVVAKDVRDALQAAIEANTWMEPASKAAAKAKLEGLRFAIGRPTYDPDFSMQPMGRGSFGGNVLIASTWHHREEMRRIGRGNADRRWDVRPQHPALSYDLAHNRLFATAAVLQAPVLDEKDAVAAHYGAFGALVGHELTNAVSGRGHYVDGKGNIGDWWTPGTASAWATRTGPLSARYSGFAYTADPARKVDGARTLEKNIADVSGVELAWAAYLKAEPKASKADRERFFRAWSGVWAQQLSPLAAAEHAALSVYAPGQWRSNGPLMQHDGFVETFGCKAGDAMFVPAAERVTVWR